LTDPDALDRARDAEADALAQERGMFSEGQYSPEWMACWLFCACGRDFRKAYLAWDKCVSREDMLYRMKTLQALLKLRPQRPAIPYQPTLTEEQLRDMLADLARKTAERDRK
jgi:hypothetical protein